jgi:hypothetical protein
VQSASSGMAGGGGPEGGGSPSEEELRQAYEQQIKQIRVEQLLLENVVTILNLGMRRTGLSPGTEDERDLDQVRVAIEAVRGAIPALEASVPTQVGPIRDALSQLQMAFVKLGGRPPAPAEAGPPPPPSSEAGPPPPPRPAGPGGPEGEQPKPGEPGPAQRSGRLWIPGQ